MDAALQADFGGAALPGLQRAPLDLVEVEIVGPPAQVLRHLAFRERAELAAEVADVGVVDVAVDDVGDRVAARRAPQRIGRRHDMLELGAARREQARRSRPRSSSRPSAARSTMRRRSSPTGAAATPGERTAGVPLAVPGHPGLARAPARPRRWRRSTAARSFGAIQRAGIERIGLDRRPAAGRAACRPPRSAAPAPSSCGQAPRD